jgi:hypothetical protein
LSVVEPQALRSFLASKSSSQLCCGTRSTVAGAAGVLVEVDAGEEVTERQLTRRGAPA